MIEIGAAVIGLVGILIGVLANRSYNKANTKKTQAETQKFYAETIQPLVDRIESLENTVHEAILHIDALRVYIYDNVPNADPPTTPAKLRK